MIPANQENYLKKSEQKRKVLSSREPFPDTIATSSIKKTQGSNCSKKASVAEIDDSSKSREFSDENKKGTFSVQEEPFPNTIAPSSIKKIQSSNCSKKPSVAEIDDSSKSRELSEEKKGKFSVREGPFPKKLLHVLLRRFKVLSVAEEDMYLTSRQLSDATIATSSNKKIQSSNFSRKPSVAEIDDYSKSKEYSDEYVNKRNRKATFSVQDKPFPNTIATSFIKKIQSSNCSRTLSVAEVDDYRKSRELSDVTIATSSNKKIQSSNFSRKPSVAEIDDYSKSKEYSDEYVKKRNRKATFSVQEKPFPNTIATSFIKKIQSSNCSRTLSVAEVDDYSKSRELSDV
ncbi:hypothetical protein TNCT_319551 [Trichonephila clavata]|uniref:Uncharacterized protein n=1 Tax=Trichonephila clavata TaxID=2740835 RepID=A0A8X6GAE1_TRICU|nr:hypothetical protein TNCT_319551 [Trichonephila clavata]